MDVMCDVRSAHVRRQRGGRDEVRGQRGRQSARWRASRVMRPNLSPPSEGYVRFTVRAWHTNCANRVGDDRDRIRIIFVTGPLCADLLDCGSNKKALQEVDKVLRKWPKLQCARALKSLATLRLGRAQDALVLIDALAQDLPTDDSTLLVMTIVYRETHQCEPFSNSFSLSVVLRQLWTVFDWMHVALVFEVNSLMSDRCFLNN